MLTRFIFMGIIAAIVLQRLLELRHSKQNAGYIIAQGGREHDDNLLGAVKVLQVSWWIAMIVEVCWLERPFIPVLAAAALLATLAGQVLRYLSMRSLGQSWTLPIITLPHQPVVDYGVYSYLRHPNWLGVILEITALPLIHSAYLTAIFFSLANAWLMSKRIKAEERALSKDTNYSSAMLNKPRFIPAIRFFKAAKNS